MSQRGIKVSGAETAGESRRAWLVLGLLVLLMVINQGSRSAFGNFLKPLVDQLGTNRASLSVAFTAGSIFSGAMQPAVGRALDRYGARAVIVPSGIALAAGYYLMTTARSLFELYLYFGVFVGIGLAGTSTAVTYPIALRWFRRRRSIALGLLGAAGMAGSLSIVPSTMLIAVSFGWELALSAIGLIAVLAVLPIAFGLIPDRAGAAPPRGAPSADAGGSRAATDDRRVPAERVRRTTDARDAGRAPEDGGRKSPAPSAQGATPFRQRTFWLLVVPSCASSFSGTLVQVHFIPMLIDRGYSDQFAANSLGLVSGIGLAAVLAGGALAVRLGERNVLTLLYLVRAAGLLLIPFAGVPAVLYLSVLLTGLSWGGVQPMTGGVAGEAFERRSLGTVLSWVFAIQNVIGATAAVIGGAVFDALGSYNAVFVANGVLLLVGASLTASIAHFSGESFEGGEPVR